MTSGTRAIRVLFAIPALDRGGPDRVLFELISALDRERFAPSLLVSQPNGHYLSRLPADVPIEILGDAGTFRDRYPLVRALRFVRQTAPDVVLATQRMTFTLGLVAPAFPRTTRLVLRQANDLSADFAMLVKRSPIKHRIAKQLALSTLRRADVVVCQSTAMSNDLRTLLGPKATLRVISNPIDTDRTALEAAGLDVTLPGRPSLVAVGRLMHQKGFDVLLRALSVVRIDYPEIHLSILGDGPDRVALETLTKDLDLTRHVTFAGYSSHPLPYVRRADLFVLASRYEGFPNAALEALACGTPVVLTDCPGANSEIVVPGMNGRLAAAVDEHAFASALRSAIAELPSYERGKIVENCKARFGRHRIVATYEDLLTSATARRLTDKA